VDPDPHLIERKDPESDKLAPYSHRFADAKPKCMDNLELFQGFEPLQYLEARSRIRIKVKGRIRIRKTAQEDSRVIKIESPSWRQKKNCTKFFITRLDSFNQETISVLFIKTLGLDPSTDPGSGLAKELRSGINESGYATLRNFHSGAGHICKK
jgi:hypothetical protein